MHYIVKNNENKSHFRIFETLYNRIADFAVNCTDSRGIKRPYKIA